MTANLQDSQKEKESDNDTNDIDSLTTILTAKKMMSKIRKHVMEDNCNCCKGPWS